MTATVGINLLWLVPGQVGGSEESTVASLLALHALAPADLELRLFARESFAAAHPDVVDAFPTVQWGGPARSRSARIVAESTWLARRTADLDLVHHAGGTLPAVRRAPSALTVHDLQPLEQAATHSAIKRAYLRATVPRSVRAARVIVTPSEFVRQSVLTHVGVEPASVVVVPHAVDLPRATTPRPELEERYELDGPVILYPAITYPHKNHRTLVAAFADVVRRHPGALLVLTGGEGGSESAVRSQIDALGLADRVRRTGRVSAADVAGLYDLASVVAVPSRYEGFGLPAVEALLHGAPLVAADATALREVVGEAGLLVRPDDVVAWANAMVTLLEDPARRALMATAGREQARRYRGEANATGLAEVYRQALRTV
jgi:glycosyltransferase involved in cell wall biosynthesis